jgi:hypothetical protein
MLRGFFFPASPRPLRFKNLFGCGFAALRLCTALAIGKNSARLRGCFLSASPRTLRFKKPLGCGFAALRTLRFKNAIACDRTPRCAAATKSAIAAVGGRAAAPRHPSFRGTARLETRFEENLPATTFNSIPTPAPPKPVVRRAPSHSDRTIHPSSRSNPSPPPNFPS